MIESLTLDKTNADCDVQNFTSKEEDNVQKRDNIKAKSNTNPPIFNSKNSDLNGYNEVAAKIDPSKTKVYSRGGETVTTYYDKNGKELMRVTEGGRSGKHLTVEFVGKDGLRTVLNDFDGDGNVDNMDVLKNWGVDGAEEYVDEDDDGTFDTKIVRDGHGGTKRINLKG